MALHPPLSAGPADSAGTAQEEHLLLLRIASWKDCCCGWPWPILLAISRMLLLSVCLSSRLFRSSRRLPLTVTSFEQIFSGIQIPEKISTKFWTESLD